MKLMDMATVYANLNRMADGHREFRPPMAETFGLATMELTVGKPRWVVDLLMKRRAFYLGWAKEMPKGTPDMARRKTQQRLEEIRIIDLMLDRLAEEYPIDMIWGDKAAARTEQLRVMRANESTVISYLRDQVQMFQSQDNGKYVTYARAAVELEAGNPELTCTLLRHELNNCDSDARLRELARKLRQMLDNLAVIYGTFNVWGE